LSGGLGDLTGEQRKSKEKRSAKAGIKAGKALKAIGAIISA